MWQKTSSGIKQIKTYAFLDSSSNTKLVSKEISSYLEVNGEIENLNINNALSKTSEMPSEAVSMKI